MAEKGILIWRHDFTGDVSANEQVLRAFEIAEKGEGFQASREGLAQIRAFMVGTIGSMARIGPTPPTATPRSEGGPEEVSIRLAASTRPDSKNFQIACSAGLLALACGTTRKIESLSPVLPGKKRYVVTEGGNPNSATREETGIFPWIPLIIAGATIAIAGLVTSAVDYMAALNAEQNLREMEADHKRQLVAQSIALTTKTINDHADREEEKGQSLAWNEGELSVLGTLKETIKDAVKWEPVLSPVPDVRAVTQKAGEAIVHVGEGVGEGIKTASWAVPAAIVAALYLALEAA